MPQLDKYQKHFLPLNVAYSNGKTKQRPVADASAGKVSLNSRMPHGYASDNLLSSILYARSNAFISFLDLKSAYWNVILKDKSAS